MSDRKNDPAFIYFPTNYRWSMGLLLCLSAAPWGGAEIDEVNRVGRALRDKIGDDHAWFEEWARMGDIVEARGREAEKKGHRLTAAACLMRAAHYIQIGERFLQHGPRSREVYKKAVKSFADGAAMLRRPRIESVEIPYGEFTLQGERVVDVAEKPRKEYPVNAGIYVLEPSVVELIPRDQYVDATDLLRLLLGRGLPVAAYLMREYWLDVGRQFDFEKANRDVAEGLLQ